ncbi:glycosyltransferase [Rhizobium sp. P44RR-XXIV]|uniref:glycosyltransferase n=1 Tax=Rhizobium sp. P44RR-XXIV TaxID=1921145 RepID=UPI0010AA6A7F|nr:glycosyltransferase [Rhizobium sp. P44RR-XXIV]TIX87101.1 glycosyltransferase [Rhizobium sp. P44RR-XXIV]
MLALGAEAHFISGNIPFENIPNTQVVGLNGQGFASLKKNAVQPLVHIHGIWTPFEYRAFREARRRGALVVISPHGALEPWAFRHKRVKKQVAWWLYQKRILQGADLLVVNSTQEMERLRDLGLTPPIAIIPNGVDLQGFPRNGAERERIVLFFSRLVPKKGVLDLIDAWSAVDNRKGFRLHIHGHGDMAYTEKIEQRIEACNSGDIALMPPVFGGARWDVFTKASVYVLPSYSENFGITVAEALTAGLPVITTHATPWGELSSEGLGWVVDNDVGQLRDALQAAINLDASMLSAMRKKAQIYAGQRFGWDAIAEQYAETYRWISQPEKASPGWVDRR